MRVFQWILLLAGALVGASVMQAAERPAAVDIGSDKHLFIDERLIAKKAKVELRANAPQREELTMIADRPWERGGITSYGNVFWDPNAKQYRAYYVSVDPGSTYGFSIAMATSADAIHWEKPNLGAVEWQGSKENNIVIDGQREGTVMIDPAGATERRYLYLSSRGDLKTRLLASPDGIHWTMQPGEIWGTHSDSQISAFWDERIHKYVYYPRVFNETGRAIGRVETSRPDERWPEKVPVVLQSDRRDPAGMDFYTNAAEKYQLAPNVYVAFPTPYYHHYYGPRTYLLAPTMALGGKTNDGKIESQLATSRDGIHWTRYRAPYVPLHHYEELDLKLCMMYPGMVYRDNCIYQYYAGYAFTHGDTQARQRLKGRELGGVFRLEQRIDGFVSADFDYEGGVVETVPLVFQGNCLLLNVNTSASGEARVGILNGDGSAIEGFGVDDCFVINGDYLARPVVWRGDPDVSRLAGKAVRLRFEMRGTKLYAMQFAKRDVERIRSDLLGLWTQRIDDRRNIAPSAVATASSSHRGDFTPQKAVDGEIGSPRAVDAPQVEWASDGEKAGAWLKLEWKEPVVVDSISVYDRTSGGDGIVRATVDFSDGSSVVIGGVPDDGKSPAEIGFDPKRITWLRLTVNEAAPGTSNVGVAEIVVREAKK